MESVELQIGNQLSLSIPPFLKDKRVSPDNKKAGLKLIYFY